MIRATWAGQIICMHEPRYVLGALSGNVVEMKRNRSFSLCCGAGGAQMFKEAEKGNKEIFIERTEDALGTGARNNCHRLSVLHDHDDRWTEIQEQGRRN